MTPSRRTTRRLVFLAWSLFALANLALFLAGLRQDFNQMLVPCSGEGCNFLSITGTEVAVLESWGLTTSSYALFMGAVMIIVLAVYWFLGGLVLWRLGATRVGLAVSLALIVLPVSTYVGSNNWSAGDPRLFGPAVLTAVLDVGIMLAFFYLMPSGYFSPRRSWIFLLTFFGLMTVLTLETNGILMPSAGTLAFIGAGAVIHVLLTAGFQVYRYRNDSTPLEQQQTKWILFGILSYALSVVIWVLVFGGALDIPAGRPRLLANIIGWSSDLIIILSLPAAITIAILRYRLWDIDLVIRRTIQYALLTALLGLVYFSGVVVLQNLFVAVVGRADSPMITVISTLTIAALFNPLRRRIQAFIDHRFFRRKYDADRALKSFAMIARDEVKMDQLASGLLGVVNKTMQPERANLWLMKKGNTKDYDD
jgi:hypothetical protein